MNPLPGANGGGWSNDTYTKLHSAEFNTGMASYMSTVLHPTSVLELGSGLGHVAKHLNDSCCHVPVHCIEPNEVDGVYNKTAGPILYSIDIFNEPLPTDMHRVYDLVLSIEMAEHVARKLHTRLFDFLVSRAGQWIVFSGASIGQPGHGHIACRDELDWRSEFVNRGMTFRPAETSAIRKACNHKNKYHQKNLQVFKNRQGKKYEKS